MPASYETATSEMLALFKAAWDAGEESAPVAVFWPNVRDDVNTAKQSPTDAALPWARIGIQHVSGRQTSVGSPDGSRRFEHAGLITVELRVPMGRGPGLANRLATVAANAFRGKTTASGVTFRNPRPRETGADGPWHRVDVLVEFLYDEVVQ